jgi:hypothetical protein
VPGTFEGNKILKMKKIYLIILTLLITVAAKAQITTAVISGKVVDAKGVTMPGVTVSVLNTAQVHVTARKPMPMAAIPSPTLTPAALIL